jgi:hypothetical protein
VGSSGLEIQNVFANSGLGGVLSVLCECWVGGRRWRGGGAVAGLELRGPSRGRVWRSGLKTKMKRKMLVGLVVLRFGFGFAACVFRKRRYGFP